MLPGGGRWKPPDAVDNEMRVRTVRLVRSSCTRRQRGSPRGDATVCFEINQPVDPERTTDRTGVACRDVVTFVPVRYATGVPTCVAGDDSSHNLDLVP